jgi:hypothetical protein
LEAVPLKMASLAPIFKKAYLIVLFVTSFYILALIALTNPWLQRQQVVAYLLEAYTDKILA